MIIAIVVVAGTVLRHLNNKATVSIVQTVRHAKTAEKYISIDRYLALAVSYNICLGDEW